MNNERRKRIEAAREKIAEAEVALDVITCIYNWINLHSMRF